MEYKEMNGSIYLRVDKGEEVSEAVRTVCIKEKIYGGFFHGIGACGKVTLSTYLPDKNDFTDHMISGMIEMVSLMGNISMDCDNTPFLHSHAVFSYLDENSEITISAGHLKEAEISYTGEIIITPAGNAINRKFAPEIGIDIWRLV